MKLIFAGTPNFAVPVLQAILQAGHKVTAVLTQPDKPQGRKGVLTPPPVKSAAQAAGIPVLQPQKLKEDFSVLKDFSADAMVTCAYGQILTQEIFDLFPKGIWNVHASLLPAYRGAAPIARAIMDGAERTGITVMKTELGLDTGDILLRKPLSIQENDTAGSLSEKLSNLGAESIVEALKLLEGENYTLTKQGEGFICKKVARTQVDFSRSAKEVSRLVRALSPAPLAFGIVGGLTVNFYMAECVEGNSSAPFGTVLSASPKSGLIVQCAQGAVRFTLLQPAGGKIMKDKDFCNGRKLSEGARFDQPVL